MFKQGEYLPGTATPVTGTYHLCNVLGGRTGLSGDFVEGQRLPATPKGWFWSIDSPNDPQFGIA
jgi:hypothetical protein